MENIEKNIEKYIKSSILCPKCLIPEWDGENCKACGHNNYVSKKNFTEEDIEDKVVNIHDIEISKLMYYLYDQLDKKLNLEQEKIVEKCLDYCWCDEESNNSKKKIHIVNKKLEKYNIPIYSLCESDSAGIYSRCSLSENNPKGSNQSNST